MSKLNYVITQTQTINAGQSISFLGLVNCATEFNPISVTSDSGSVKVFLYEAPTVTNNGTQMSPIAINRHNNRPASTLVYGSPTVTNNGLKLYEFQLLGDKHYSTNGTMSNGFNLINAPYLYKIQNVGSSSVNISITFSWIESHEISDSL